MQVFRQFKLKNETFQKLGGWCEHKTLLASQIMININLSGENRT